MRKLFLAFSILAVSTVAAFAADMAPRSYAKTPPPIVAAAYDWSGFYVGANAGGAFGSSFDPSTTVVTPSGYFSGAGSPAALNSAGSQSIKPNGFTGGFEAGYNWQIGSSFVIGLEGDIEYLGLKGSAASSAVYPCCAPATLTVSSNVSTNWLATARGRLGFAANDWLFFGTGGAAFTNLKGNFAFADNCGQIAACNGPGGANGAEAASFSSTKTGYVVGAGVEKAVGANWTVKAEYLYVNFSSITGSGIVPSTGGGPGTLVHSFDLKTNIVRAGINYKFGGPVVARY